MAVSSVLLGLHEGLTRPAIATILPTSRNPVVFIDSGANVDCSAAELLQFAWLGAVYAEYVLGRNNPVIGLLSIGEEDAKGNSVSKDAHGLFREAGFNFHGNVEGRDLPPGASDRGPLDVVVCDGFVGNVALKTSEGLAQMLGAFLREEFGRGPVATMMAVLSYPALRRFKRRTDHRTYNGACLIGLRGIVVKSHGSADAIAFEAALRRAYDAARNDLIGRIGAALPGAAAVAQSSAAAQAENAARMRRRQADIIGKEAPDMRA
jgi:glycerol-3-phosphate acyltransferase PlsX